MGIRVFFVALFLSLIAACGGSPESVAEQATATEAAVEEATAQSLNEPAVDTAPAVAEKPAAAAGSAPRTWKYRQGAHYQQFANAQGTSSSPDKIEVAEVFWYGCPHCFSFEPYLEKWKPTLGSDVSFVRIPVMWNPTNEIHARLFYTIQALGIQDEAHGAIFSELHTNRKMLASEGAQRDFITSNFDVSEEDFDKAYRSFSVNGKLQQAKTFTQRYQVRSVPLLIINGKYATTGDEVRSLDEVLEIADELIERERQSL